MRICDSNYFHAYLCCYRTCPIALVAMFDDSVGGAVLLLTKCRRLLAASGPRTLLSMLMLLFMRRFAALFEAPPSIPPLSVTMREPWTDISDGSVPPRCA